MKLKFQQYLLVVLCLFLVTGFSKPAKQSITGSWKFTKGNETWLLMAADNYCMVTHYDHSGKKFFQTFGGFQFVKNGKLHLNYRFHSGDKSKTGTIEEFTWSGDGKRVKSNLSGEMGEWVNTGAANNEMTGIWRITKRKEGQELKEIQLAPRRTLKFLTSDRFQWAAINITTGEFFGTGGGTYTFENGSYVETIEFFSRDSSRVGMALEFKDHLEGQNWIHTGLSSKGEPIYEIWSKTRPEER